MKILLEHLGNIHDLIHDISVSGKWLKKEVTRRAAVLDQYVAPGENMFVIAHANTASFFADLLAVWNVGGCAVCLNTGLTADELDNVIRFVNARAVLVDNDTVVTQSAPVVCCETATPGQKMKSIHGGLLDDPALILFTSGTTGDPKGVVHTYRSILSRVALNQAYIGKDVLARTLCVLPTHFGHGLIGNCLTPLLAGCDLFLMHGAGVDGTSKLGKILDTHEISFMSSVPTFWKMALRIAAKPSMKTLGRVSIGSAPLSAELWKGVMDWTGTPHVANMYGITETANWVGGVLASDITPENGLLGGPWGGHCAILGEDGKILPYGEGEILLQTPSVMSGYYKRPDLTKEVLKNGWYYTGDIGTLDENGLLRMTGRNRYAINKGGIKIYPEELDLLLERHPDVQEACAFGVKDVVSGETAAIAVKIKDEVTITNGELSGWIEKRIRSYALPSYIFQVPEIPKTDRGKLNRDIVARHCLSKKEMS